MFNIADGWPFEKDQKVLSVVIMCFWREMSYFRIELSRANGDVPLLIICTIEYLAEMYLQLTQSLKQFFFFVFIQKNVKKQGILHSDKNTTYKYSPFISSLWPHTTNKTQTGAYIIANVMLPKECFILSPAYYSCQAIMIILI